MESHDTKVEEEQNYNRLNSMQDYFLPYSSFRIKWDALLLGLITYTCVFTPLQTSMIDMIPERNENLLSILRVLDFAIDVIFGFDFILSFNFAYFDEVEGAKTLTRERSATFLHYLKTPRCLLSLVSLVPLVVDILIYGNIRTQKGNDSTIERSVSVCGVLRTLRIALSARSFDSLDHYIRSLGVSINSSMSRMAVLLFFFVMGVSISGCFYFFVACHSIGNKCHRTWLGEISYNSSWAVVDTQVGVPWETQFSRSIYFAMQTLFTIGYGDSVVPISSNEVLVACSLMYIGQFAYACIIANLSSLMGNMNVVKMRFLQEMDALTTYMEARCIPHGLRLRVKEFFDYTFQKQYGMLDSKIITSIPLYLSKEIVQEHARRLSKVPFFSSTNRSWFITEAAAKKFVVRTYIPNSIMMYLHEKQRELIMMVRGSADVYSSISNQSIATLLPGDFIGDYQMVFGTANIVSVKSGLTFVDVLVLSHEDLFRVLADFECTAAISALDRGVKETIETNLHRTERFSKLHECMKKTAKNKKVMDMLKTAAVAHDRFIILPSSRFHVYWDILKLLALAYFCFMIPYRIMLHCGERNENKRRCNVEDCKEWRIDLVVDYIVDSVFLADMLMNFRCFAFNDIQDGRDVLITSPDSIMLRYSTSYRIIFDLIGSVPMDFLGVLLGGYYSLLRLTHLCRVGLLSIYLSDLQGHLIDSYDVHLSSGYVSIVKNAISILIIFHLIAVLWAVLHYRDPSEYPYLDSMYWVVTTFTTVGYGDVVPEDPLETGAAFFIGTFGALFAAAVVANVTAYVHSAEVSESSVPHQKRCLKRFLVMHNMSSSLEYKIMSYFNFLENTTHQIDESKFLAEVLPINLQHDFSLYTRHKVLFCVPIFENCGLSFLQKIIHILQQRFYVADEWIIAERYPANGMYIQNTGHTEIVCPEMKAIKRVHGFGGYFGHETLMRAIHLSVTDENQEDKYFARTVTESELWFLDPLHFRMIVETFPESLTSMRLSLVERQEELSQANFVETSVPSNYMHDFQETYVNPSSQFMALWRCAILIGNTWNAISIPFRVAFAAHWTFSWRITTIDYVIDIIFFIDIIIRSRYLAFVKDDQLTTTALEIMRNYTRNDHVCVHIISAIPFEICVFFTNTGCFYSKIQYFTLLRINRLFRTVEVPTLFEFVERYASKSGLNFNKSVLRVAKLMCRMLIASHIFACFFFFIAAWENYLGQCKNWAYKTRIFDTCATKILEDSCTTSPFSVAEAYIASLYWAVATLTTVGYGDIHASKGCPVEVFFCTFVMIVGIFFIYTLIIANLEEIVAKIDVTQSLFKQRCDKIRQYYVRRKLPESLVHKIDEYIENIWAQQHGIRGTCLLRYLPQCLQSQVVSELAGRKISKLFFVESCDQNFIFELTTSLSLEYYAVNDVIFRTGQPAQTLFLMIDGVAQLIDEPTGTLFSTMKDCILGEGEFFSRSVHPCSCRLSSRSEIFTISFDLFWRIVEARRLSEKYCKAVDEGQHSLYKRSALSLIENLKSNLSNKKMAKMMASNGTLETEEFTLSLSSKFYKIWKIIGLFFTIYISLSVPYTLAFETPQDEDNMSLQVSSEYMLGQLLMDLFFLLFFSVDIALHLSVFVCKHEGRIVTKRHEFRSLYIRRSMVIDLLSVCPISVFFYRNNEGLFSLTYASLRLFQLTRVIRVGEYFRVFVAVVEEIFNFRITSTGMGRLIDWIPLTLLLNHWVACVFYFISKDRQSETWVSHWTLLCNKQNIALYGPKCSTTDMYLRSFYWALYTLTTTGYGQVKISSSIERIFSMFVMVLGGVICDAGITAILTSMFNEEDRELATRKRQIECTMKYLSSNEYSTKLKERVLEFFRYVGEEMHNLLDYDVVSSLSPSLQFEAANHFCFASLRDALIFSNDPDPIIYYLIARMSPYLAVPNEQLQGKNVRDDALYVLLNGHVERNAKGFKKEILHPGALIGEREDLAIAAAQGDTEQQTHIEVLAMHFSHLYKLNMNELTKLRIFLSKVDAPLKERFPCAYRLCLGPADARRIINCCKIVYNKVNILQDCNDDRPERALRCSKLLDQSKRAYKNTAIEATFDREPCDADCIRSDTVTETSLQADEEATNLSSSNEHEDNPASFGAFDSFMEDAFFRYRFDCEKAIKTSIFDRIKISFQKFFGLLESQVYPTKNDLYS